MGANSSKIGQVPDKELTTTEGSVPSTPILTNKIVKKLDDEFDPRSPTANIARTPIQLFVATPKTPKSETTTANELELQCRDPRSPTIEFTRTPITLNVDKKLYNKNLEKVRRLSSNIVSPKLLDSSPISAEMAEQNRKRRSFVGLLETNIDFTETDLDEAMKEKSKENKVIDVVSNNDLFDPESPADELEGAAIEVCIKVGEIELNHSMSSEDIEDLSEINVVVAEVVDELIINVEILLKSKVEPESVPESPIKPIINLAADFDKKLTHLIYEDDETLTIPKLEGLKSKSRTPLGNRNDKAVSKKPVLKLKVSDKPRKLEYPISRIPVFNKEQKKFGGKVQCENTPPRTMEKRSTVKGKRTQWDADNTLLI